MKLNKTELFVPITKTEKQADGTVLVYGKATGPDLDSDLQIADAAWLKTAMPKWFESGANVREMHQPIAAGVGQTLEQIGDDWYLKALIVDPGSVKKVETGVLQGYSIGIKAPKIVKDAAAPNGRIIGGAIVETSLADRGCNTTCKLAIAKADGIDGDVMVDVADEVEEISLLEAARKAIAALIYAEANELLEGGEAEGAIRALLWALDDLDWYAEVDAYEDAVSKAASATKKGSAMQLTEFVTAIKTASADDATDEQKALVADVRDALFPTTELEVMTGELMKFDGPGLVELAKVASADDLGDEEKNAIAELRKVLGVDDATDATTTADERVSALEERLVKVEELAAPGGPAGTRPADAANAVKKEELLTKAAGYRELAKQVTDQSVADGYRQLAARAEQTAAAATP